MIGIDRFGASASGQEVMNQFGFTAAHVTSAALRLLGRNDDADKEYGPETAIAATALGAGYA